MANALGVEEPAAVTHELTQLVSFTVEGEQFGVDVLKVSEIIRLPSITHVPTAPPYVEGVINLRGSVIPIISMRERFGLQLAESDSRTRIIVMTVGNSLMGFKVDTVSEVTRVSGSDIKHPPSMLSGSDGHQCIIGVTSLADQMLIIIDPERMFSETEVEQFFLKQQITGVDE